MTPFQIQMTYGNAITQAKSEGKFRLAGQIAAIAGQTDYYGCHFGLRSTLALAQIDFRAGWAEVDLLLRQGDVYGG